MSHMKCDGPRTLSCGTLERTSAHSDSTAFTATFCLRPVRKLHTQFSIWLETPHPLSFLRSLVRATLLNT